MAASGFAAENGPQSERFSGNPYKSKLRITRDTGVFDFLRPQELSRCHTDTQGQGVP